MRKLIIFMLGLFCLLSASVYELYYDCNDGTGFGDSPYTFGTSDHGSARERFTPPFGFTNSRLTQIKVLWSWFLTGAGTVFRVTIREPETGFSITSAQFTAPNETTWSVYDLNSLNYRTTTSDFYVELIPEDNNRVGIYTCGHTPIDWRSQKRDDTYFTTWTDIDHDYFIHVFLDNTGSQVSPSSVGSIKALYK